MMERSHENTTKALLGGVISSIDRNQADFTFLAAATRRTVTAEAKGAQVEAAIVAAMDSAAVILAGVAMASPVAEGKDSLEAVIRRDIAIREHFLEW